jgi:hypothetical protein
MTVDATIRVTKAVLFTFEFRNTAGQVDNTTAATPGSSNQGVVKTFINPSNPREAAAVVMSTANPTGQATVTLFGHTIGVTIATAPAPDLSGGTVLTIGAEIDPPSWAQ